MLVNWFRARWTRRSGAGAPGSTGFATPDGPAERPRGRDGEEADPVFEGGGAVLLSPSFWEKAGWGVAILAAMTPCLG